MAEASVAEAPTAVSPKFFCHRCSVEIPRVLPVMNLVYDKIVTDNLDFCLDLLILTLGLQVSSLQQWLY